MELQHFTDRLAAGSLTRRQMHRALAGVGLAAVATPVVRRPARAAGEVSYFTWAGYDVPEVAGP